ncbi:MAG: hypothetical protein ABI575_01075 [Oxalobacteraceae bacterium]
MKKIYALLSLASLFLTGCGGGVSGEVVVDAGPAVLQPVYEDLRHPTISGLAYFNSVTGSESHLTTAAGGYVGYTGGDIVTFVLGDMVLFTIPGDLAQPFSSLYDASLYSTSTLHSNTAVENLMAFLMAIDDDGNYTNGIQIAYPVRVAAFGLRVNFNQSAYYFRTDPAVQYATAVLSANTLYGTRVLPSPSEAVVALQTP